MIFRQIDVTFMKLPKINRQGIFFITFFLLLLSFAHVSGSAHVSFISPSSSFISIQEDQEIPKTSSPIYSNIADCDLSETFTKEVLRWKPDICRWSKEHKLEPDLIATIMQIESCGNSKAVSSTGVRGLFQVTGMNLDGQNPFDPNVSMSKGPAKVLKNELRLADGNIKAAFAGYNGGGKAREFVKGKISRNQFYWYLRRHPSGYWRTDAKALAKINEVEWYAYWANIFYEAKSGKRNVLNKWLSMGGSRLCTQAAKTT